MLHVNALAGSVPSSVSVASPLNVITSPAWKEPPSWGERIEAVGGVADADRERRRLRGIGAVGHREPSRCTDRIGYTCA